LTDLDDLDAVVGDARFEVLRPAPPIHAVAPTSAELDDLLPQLTVERSAIRCAAANRLSRSLHAPFVVEPLIALLKDDDRGVRRAAMSALAESGDARAVGPLRAVMKGNGSLREEAGRTLGQLERRLAERGGDARNPDAPQAIQTAREIREATAARKLRLRSEVRKGVRLKLVSLPLWGAGVALFVIGVVSGAALAIVAGIAFGLLGFAAMEYADRYMPAEGLREYATCCDPDLSQSWAVGIALGGGLDGGGGGFDG
jgi:HEAT repeats